MVVVLALCSCAAHSSGAKRSAATAPPATAKVVAAAAPTQNRELVDGVTQALLRADLAAAAALVDRARQLPPSSRPSAQLVAYFDATVHSYRGDYRGAAKVMYEHLAMAGPTSATAFEFHDAMIALRTADGDLLGALVECEEMVKAGVLGTWGSSTEDRMTMTRLKEHWHRAYLLRMFAQTRLGAEREAFIAYAESARQQYGALATPLGGMEDAIAVLDAYFAFCDGVPSGMREATQRVNIAHDDDMEDLYLVQLALDGAGDTEAAAAVRRRMRAQTSATVLAPVFLAWLRADEAAVDGRSPHFSPKYPTGSRPD